MKAEKAKALLEDQTFRSAMDDLRKACYDNIKRSSHDQQDLREDMYYMLRAADAFERILRSRLNDGKINEIDFNIKRMIR